MEKKCGRYLSALPGRTGSANEVINHKDCECMLQLEVEDQMKVVEVVVVACSEGGGVRFERLYATWVLVSLERVACDCATAGHVRDEIPESAADLICFSSSVSVYGCMRVRVHLRAPCACASSSATCNDDRPRSSMSLRESFPSDDLSQNPFTTHIGKWRTSFLIQISSL